MMRSLRPSGPESSCPVARSTASSWAILFSTLPRKKKRLDAIVHPRVFERSAELIAAIGDQTPNAVVILDIPLLLEAGMGRDMAEVIVVYVPEAVQLERLMKRDGIDRKAAMARIRSQMSIEEKRRRATLVIDNSGTLAACRDQALAVYERLKHQSG